MNPEIIDIKRQQIRYIMAYRYTLKSTGSSSAKLGNCEVCAKTVIEVYHQVEEKQYTRGWTRHECSDLFGHEECLISTRR